MGGVAALLAGACVAPVVIQVVIFASNLYSTGTTVALALQFCLGIGMAAPWPLAGAGLASLPKPGLWMVRVKQGFGVLILISAAYYGHVAYDLVADRWVDPSAVAQSAERQVQAGWTPSLAAGLARAARDQKPVVIDLWATWCKNCLVMDKTTLASADVTSALAGYVKIKYQAERPDDSPAKDVMNNTLTHGQFGREYVHFLDDRRLRQELGRVRHQRSGDAARQVCLPAILIWEGIENAERRRPKADGEPHRRGRLGFDEGQPSPQEGRDFVLFPGLCFQPNQ
jgi:thiol-disulfide isomerase/thioredoxin